jgi:hypothetical protein
MLLEGETEELIELEGDIELLIELEGEAEELILLEILELTELDTEDDGESPGVPAPKLSILLTVLSSQSPTESHPV